MVSTTLLLRAQYLFNGAIIVVVLMVVALWKKKKERVLFEIARFLDDWCVAESTHFLCTYSTVRSYVPVPFTM